MAQVFSQRHIGPSNRKVSEMLKEMKEVSVESLLDKTIPAEIRLNSELNIASGMTEVDYLKHMETMASKNKGYTSFIGLGYYGTIVPSVVQRNVFENPGWYTAYTPYQAEIAQGRLEALLNFQTMVMDLTGMEIANASLLDEGTAAAEAMIMFFNTRSRASQKAGHNKFFISDACYPQTIDVVTARAIPLNIEVVVGDFDSIELDESYFGALLQYPEKNGAVQDYSNFVKSANDVETKVVVAADIMSLVLLTPPGEWGADAVVGNTQRFGVPMGYGGPHAAYFATKEDYKRNIPGRIIGVSQDADGNPALRMALQTREQHIRRDKATSNICTAQALLAVMAGMYAVYHGPEGIRSIAKGIHAKTKKLGSELSAMGFQLESTHFFDTILVTNPPENLKEIALEHEVNFRYDAQGVGISLDETTRVEHLNLILAIFSKAGGKTSTTIEDIQDSEIAHARKSEILNADVFNSYHSETEMMRYLKRLENKDLSLVHSMIPLGSCTMKLNAASELGPLSNPLFANVHPFVPVDQAAGYQQIIEELDRDLSEITGFAKVSLQPNSGAQGEYAGLMVIRAFHQANGDFNRNVCLIPSSAHGTNPASAVMAGMKVVVTKCDEAGNIDLEDLKSKAEKYADDLAALMVTYPSTHGVYESAIKEVTSIVHQYGGQVYMDGANMNAQVGLTNPGNIGADVCHLNLHKTFAIPHGGGGPGMGPIGVAKHLVPFLPGNAVIESGGDQAISGISASPWGSSLILLISYGYIKMLGREGLRESTEIAILNANYLKAKLEGHYNVLYTGENNTVAHEMIVDCRSFKKSCGIEVEDIAKRLIDFGFHAPTVSFPVAGTLMIEPTESESKEELDRFAESMIKIREEIGQVESGEAPAENNILKNAPHTAAMVISDSWNEVYSREEAAYPLESLRNNKFWTSVRRVDNAYGDRNLVCDCRPLSTYVEELVES
ncbi:MAG TPA: glycine dehydrogenase (aminomethyl-transferring) [Flavobacteriales bacterium]|nr:glycine dehydrogenase (aminomethyl-transferring) [Flavobacteriales bacterium]